MQETLKQVYELIKQENDEKTPYKTKYEANDLIVKYLQDNAEIISKDDLYTLKCTQAQIAFDTQEMHLCRQSLDECEKYIGPDIQFDEIVVSIENNNQLLIYILRAFTTRMAVLGNSDNYQDAIKLYDLGNRIYNKFINTMKNGNDTSVEDKENIYQDTKYQVNVAYTTFLFIAAQIYSRAGQAEESAKLCRQTLQLQTQTSQYEYINFSQHSLDLSRYYINNRLFLDAWELLSCSAYALAQEFVSQLNKNLSEDNTEQKDTDETQQKLQSKILVVLGWIWYKTIPELPSLSQFSQQVIQLISQEKTSFNYNFDKISWQTENETPAATRQGDRPVNNLPASEQEQLLKLLEQMLAEHKISENLREQLNIFWRELGRFYLTVLQIASASGASNNQIPQMCKCRINKQEDDDSIEQLTPWVFAEHNKQYDLFHLLEQLSDTMLVSIAHADSKLLIALSQSAINALKKSLTYFLLDGWTTEHCKILLDLSYIYDLLSDFKPQQYVSYQQERVKLFETLKGDLNPQYFNDIIDEFEMHLSEAKYNIFEHEYKKLLQMHPYIENIDYRPKPGDIQPIQKVSIAAANSIQQFQCYIVQIEKAAQAKCRSNRNLNQDASIEWSSWVRCIDSDDIDSYIDAVFKQSVTLSKFPAQTPKQRFQMIERATVGFEYCVKMWNWKQETQKIDMSENLKYIQEMMTLMRLRSMQAKQLCD